MQKKIPWFGIKEGRWWQRDVFRTVWFMRWVTGYLVIDGRETLYHVDPSDRSITIALPPHVASCDDLGVVESKVGWAIYDKAVQEASKQKPRCKIVVPPNCYRPSDCIRTK